MASVPLVVTSSCLSSGDLRDLPSFPTRRSSDLLDCGRISAGASAALWRSHRAADWHDDGGQSAADARSEEHTSELQSRPHLVCRLLLEKKKNKAPSSTCRKCRLPM